MSYEQINLLYTFIFPKKLHFSFVFSFFILFVDHFLDYRQANQRL